MTEKLTGQIERVTFRNPENGFTIARLKVAGEPTLVTAAGPLPDLSTGEQYELTGEWTTHPKFGRQFKVEAAKAVLPHTADGIEKYLGSGALKGVGPATAKLIVAKFGDKTLEVLDQSPERLKEIPGIGPKKVATILKGWAAQQEVRDIFIFLQGHGVTPGLAVRIHRTYGKEAIKMVTENPYKMAEEVDGVGFKTADKIAVNVGVPKDSPDRARAGILYVLQAMSDEGHLFYPYEELIEKCRELLGIEREILTHGFSRLFEDRKIAIEDLNDPEGEFKPNNKAVYLAHFLSAENGIADRLKILLSARRKIRLSAGPGALAAIESRLGFTLSEKQREAVLTALDRKILVLTGGPGTGKTTIIKALLMAFGHATDKILLCAPTGRAAKRMAEASDREAATIHRLLEWDFRTLQFRRNLSNPLDADLVIADEASMIDAPLLCQLLKAVPDRASLILVGDVHQLPSVGPGNALRDIIASGAVPVVVLDKIFRQALDSRIVVNAHRIRQGEFPEMSSDVAGGAGEFFLLNREDADEAREGLVHLVAKRIPERYGLDPFRDIQVLTPMHRGPLGTETLNQALQDALNPEGQTLTRGHRRFRVRDRIMQIRNDYDREVFNGDIGAVEAVDPGEGKLWVRFDDRTVEYEAEAIDDLLPAWAISVHKSQGSEYPAVVMAVHTAHFIMLQRNLLYTGITRAKKLAVLVGTHKAISIALRNDKTARRFTGLKNKLVNARCL